MTSHRLPYRAIFMLVFVLLFFVAQLSRTGTIPYKTLATAPVKHSILTASHANSLPILSTIEIDPKTAVRKKKGLNIPLSIQHHQLLVPNLHVIPIQHHIHTDSYLIGDNKLTIINQNVHNSNNSHMLIPVLIPIHNLVPVHDLTVIPLHRLDTKLSSERDERERYRNPLGGYGAGWGYGGHGAGHGFHYSYG